MKQPSPRKHFFLAVILSINLLVLLAACGRDPVPAQESELIPATAPQPAVTPLQTPAPRPQFVFPEGLVISELMPDNRSSIRDGNGVFSDWIELENRGAETISMAGLYLSDSLNAERRCALPERKLEPGEFFLLFCGSEDAAPFSLNRDGETLFFSDEGGRVLQSLSYGETEKNCSVCFTDQGMRTTAYATPDYPNTEEGFEDYIRENDSRGPLVINELVSFNEDYAYHYGDCYDWVELKNISDEEVNLGDYCLSEDARDLFACRLTDRVLKPGELAVVFCSGNVDLRVWGYCHVDFRLKSGDSVFLSREGDGLSDCVTVPRMPEGSYGRIPGESGFFYLSERSPGKENGVGYRYISESPSADLMQGVYENVDELQVSLSGPGRIYYTLNGDTPDTSSAEYSEPVILTETSVLRAICCEEGKRESECAAFSYIINEGHSLPVVSVLCDRKDFNRITSRVRDREFERPAEAVMFDGETGEVVFSSDCGLKLHGASARGQKKKYFKLNFRDRYGGSVFCDPFQTGLDREYSSLVLRGGSVEYLYILKDELASLIAQEVAAEPLALDVRYCVLYINGEYYGIYALREAYSAQYAAQHTHGSPESCEIARNRDDRVMTELVDFCSTHSLTSAENYEELCSRLDVESFATWIALESYFDNVDPGGNIRYIRSDATGGKWLTAFFDLDISLFNRTTWFEPFFQVEYEFSHLSAGLIRNPDFREVLLVCSADLFHNGLGRETATRILWELYAQLDGEMPRNCKRWNQSYEMWQTACRVLEGRLQDERTISWLQSLQRVTRASDEDMERFFGEEYLRLMEQHEQHR